MDHFDIPGSNPPDPALSWSDLAQNPHGRLETKRNRWLGNVLLTMKLLPNGIIFRVHLFWPKNTPINTAHKYFYALIAGKHVIEIGSDVTVLEHA